MNHISPAVLEHALAECRKENEELRRVAAQALEELESQASEKWGIAAGADDELDVTKNLRAALAHHAAKVAP